MGTIGDFMTGQNGRRGMCVCRTWQCSQVRHEVAGTRQGCCQARDPFRVIGLQSHARPFAVEPGSGFLPSKPLQALPRGSGVHRKLVA
jgi:hypothetical protein